MTLADVAFFAVVLLWAASWAFGTRADLARNGVEHLLWQLIAFVCAAGGLTCLVTAILTVVERA